MMADQLEYLLSLASPANRQQWLQEHYPYKDELFVQLLREEASYSERNNPQRALVVAQVLSDLAALWRDQPTVAVALLVEANVRCQLTEYTAALALYQGAYDLYYALGLLVETVVAMVGWLDALLQLGCHEEAIDLAGRAIQQMRAANEQTALARMIAQRGNLYAQLRMDHAAQCDYTEARFRFEALHDQPAVAMVETNEAHVLINLNEFREAERKFAQGRLRLVAAKMTTAVAQIDQNLAYLYFAQGDYQLALRALDQARATFVVQKCSQDIASVALARCEIYIALNLWHEALVLARTTRVHFASDEVQGAVAQLWLNEAAALAHTQHNFTEVFEALNQARQIFSQEQNQVGLAITDLYQATFEQHTHQLAAARTSARQAWQRFSTASLPYRVGQCEIILGEIALAEGNLPEASHHFHQVFPFLRQANVLTLNYRWQAGLGRLCRLQGYLPAALFHLGQAVEAIEQLQTSMGAEDNKIAFHSDKLAIYEELILLCLALEMPEAVRLAFATIERAKACPAMRRGIQTTALSRVSTTEARLITEMQTLKRELHWYYHRLQTPTPWLANPYIPKPYRLF